MPFFCSDKMFLQFVKKRSGRPKQIGRPQRVDLSAAAGGLADEGHTVCALGNGGVSLVSANLDGLERAVMLCVEIILAACYIALDSRILRHDKYLFLSIFYLIPYKCLPKASVCTERVHKYYLRLCECHSWKNFRISMQLPIDKSVFMCYNRIISDDTVIAM